MSSVKAVIFDLDGLVLDSETTYMSAWQRAAAEMGHILDAAFCRSLSGLHGSSVMSRLQDHCGTDFDIDRFQKLSRRLWLAEVQQQGIPVKKGFFTALSAVERLGLAFCLATNSRRLDALRFLELAGLEAVFPEIVTRDDVTHGKPAPDVFIRAAKSLDVPLANCLVLEDSPVGIAAANAAGMSCIYVPSVFPVDITAAASAVAVFDDLEQVADFILAQAIQDSR